MKLFFIFAQISLISLGIFVEGKRKINNNSLMFLQKNNSSSYNDIKKNLQIITDKFKKFHEKYLEMKKNSNGTKKIQNKVK